jgi:hypothetical protein
VFRAINPEKQKTPSTQADGVLKIWGEEPISQSVIRPEKI